MRRSHYPASRTTSTARSARPRLRGWIARTAPSGTPTCVIATPPVIFWTRPPAVITWDRLAAYAQQGRLAAGDNHEDRELLSWWAHAQPLVARQAERSST